MAGALETARLKGLIHRALSPRSIVVQPGDEPLVFLTDFGIGTPRGRACELPSTVEDAAYRSPEEIRGEAPGAGEQRLLTDVDARRVPDGRPRLPV